MIFQWLRPAKPSLQWKPISNLRGGWDAGPRSCCATPSVRNFLEPAGGLSTSKRWPEMSWFFPNVAQSPGFVGMHKIIYIYTYVGEVYRNSTEKLAMFCGNACFLTAAACQADRRFCFNGRGWSLTPGSPSAAERPQGSSPSSPWRVMRRRRCRRWTDGQRRRETSKCRKTWASRPIWEACHEEILRKLSMLDTVPFQVGQWSLHAISGKGWVIWLMGGGSSCDKAASGRFGILPSAFDGRYL